MSQQWQTAIVWAGDFGLYATVVGSAVMLLIPGRVALGFGARMSILGAIAMGYELVLARAM
jgi:hypothetical protein